MKICHSVHRYVPLTLIYEDDESSGHVSGLYNASSSFYCKTGIIETLYPGGYCGTIFIKEVKADNIIDLEIEFL